MNLGYDISLINAIVVAAEREGGIHQLDMPGTRKGGQRRKWRRCIGSGHLWYNTLDENTRVIKIEE